MTVSYQYQVASSTSGGFTRLLFMWKGSLFKLIYRELLLFVVVFDILSALYRNTFTDDQKKSFEKIVMYCDTFINLIPLSFVLGFYVAYVAARWWQQYMAIPWPDKVMHTIALYIPGNDQYSRMVRRSMMRYLNLTLVLVLRSISSAVKKRFPTMEHLTHLGFMTESELQIFHSIASVEFNTYWIPCTWFVQLLQEIKDKPPKIDPQGVKLIMEEFLEFRSKCGLLWSYDWISIPLVYTQVVTIATYSFFIVALCGRQYVENAKKPLQMEIDIYLPIFTLLQFLFFMGLLKVAEQLINPFGDDDEDFELNWLIDRHTKVSYLGVDTLMTLRPPLEKDKYFDDSDLVLPYTGASFSCKKKTYRGSVHYLQIPEEQQDMFLPEIVENAQKERKRSLSVLRRLSSKSTSYTSNADAAVTWRMGSPSENDVPKAGQTNDTLNFERGISVDSDKSDLTRIVDFDNAVTAQQIHLKTRSLNNAVRVSTSNSFANNRNKLQQRKSESDIKCPEISRANEGPLQKWKSTWGKRKPRNQIISTDVRWKPYSQLSIRNPSRENSYDDAATNTNSARSSYNRDLTRQRQSQPKNFCYENPVYLGHRSQLEDDNGVRETCNVELEIAYENTRVPSSREQSCDKVEDNNCDHSLV